MTALTKTLNSLSEIERKELAETVLTRYAGGATIRAVAEEYRTAPATLYALLITEDETKWKDVQLSKALARFELAQSDLEMLQAKMGGDSENKPDSLELARLREQGRMAESNLKSAQWELERLFKRAYGQDQATAEDSHVIVHIDLRREGPPSTVIEEAKAVDAEPDKPAAA